jgi:uncharacterized protein YecE (DUF72 family)
MALKKELGIPLLAPPSYPKLFLGTSGWAYPTWKPGFYPADLSPKRFLHLYASRMNSVEVNYTFRAMPSAAVLDEWLAATPPGFRFSFKAPQQITHFSRLQDCGEAVEEFFNVLAPVRKAKKLGCVLFQLPPNFQMDLGRLDEFLSIPAMSARARAPIVFEFRHESWFAKAVYDRLRRSKAALCIAESDDLATPEVHPARRLAYFRLRRNGGYTPAEAAAFALRLAKLAGTREVYAYFKHEDAPTGALNAAAAMACAANLAATPVGERS